MTSPEDKAREQIDQLLEAAGWAVQDKNNFDLGAALGIVVRYFQMKEQSEADYLLFVDPKAAAICGISLYCLSLFYGIDIDMKGYIR